tara:strand:+ start:492 stop:1235 length:744 start_codon:yes stop_codon:yes gene_type:complete
MKSLKSKTIIITGASSGLGKAIALQLSRENCNLVLAARRLEKLELVSEQIKKINPQAQVLIQVTDVSKEADILNLFSKTIEHFGTIDILVNNAGKGSPGHAHNISMQEWDSVMSTNLTSVFVCSREAVKHFLSNNIKGQIITVCSIAGLYGAPGYSAYCASKHAVAGFKRSLWLETRKKGIRVSTIYPARINTEFFDNYTQKPSKGQMISSGDIADYVVIIMKGQYLRRAIKRMKILYKRVINLFLR